MATITKSRSNTRNNLAVNPNPPFHERNVAYLEARFLSDLIALQADGEITSIVPIQMLKVTFDAQSPVLLQANSGRQTQSTSFGDRVRAQSAKAVTNKGVGGY